MAQIGVKNFRKFKSLDLIELNAINIFVGKNNAGKSTVAKAAMLMLDNLRQIKWVNVPSADGRIKSSQIPVPLFNFNANGFHDLHIGSFERALCNYADEHKMVFTCEYGLNTFTFVVGNIEVDNKSYTPIESISIKSDGNCTFIFDFLRSEMSFELLKYEYSMGEEGTSLIKAREDYEQLITREKNAVAEALDSKKYLEVARINANIEKLESELKLKTTVRKRKANMMKATFDLTYYHNTKENVLVNFIESFRKLTNDQNYLSSLDKRTKEYQDFKEKTVLIETADKYIDNAIEEIEEVFEEIHVEYIQAHAATQKLILNTTDKNDVNSSVVHDYYRERIMPGEIADIFVKDWLVNFEIGTDFRIETLEGEGYYLKVKTESGWVHLADLGMGSIQLVILILRLATLLNRHLYGMDECWIVIEEPEQNIHPKLQSKLAEMFRDLTLRLKEPWAFTFLIETHSEYLIRKVQLMVSDIAMEFGERDFMNHNPFKVYYFPSERDKQPYDMIFQPNGRFVKNFGEGFYDAAGTLALELSKNADKKDESKDSFDWSDSNF